MFVVYLFFLGRLLSNDGMLFESSLLVSSVAGHYFMQETLYPVTYSICAFAIVTGLYIASKSPAFTFLGCLFAALSATGSTVFQCLQNFHPQNEYLLPNHACIFSHEIYHDFCISCDNCIVIFSRRLYLRFSFPHCSSMVHFNNRRNV